MAQTSSFFDDIAGDREYSANDFGNYFAAFLESGIFPNQLAVSSAGTDMKIDVAVGNAWIKGYLYQSTAIEELTIETAHVTYDRIDRIILRLDTNDSVRSIVLAVKKGTAGAIPAAPTLETDFAGTKICEISLAQVLVGTGVTVIAANKVTDERVEVSSLIATFSMSNFAYLLDLCTENTSPVDANTFALYVSGVIKKLSWANIKTTLKTYFDALYKSVSSSYATKTTTYTLTNADDIIDCTSGTFTVNTHASSGATKKDYAIINSGTGVITVDGNSTETINGETTITLYNNESIKISPDGTNWKITGGNYNNYRRIADYTFANSTTTSVTFSNIQEFKDIIIKVYTKSTTTSALFIRLNEDSDANYKYAGHYTSNSGTVWNISNVSNSATYVELGETSSSQYMHRKINITDFGTEKFIFSEGNVGGTYMEFGRFQGRHTNTNAISSITLFHVNTGHYFTSGDKIVIEGKKGAL